MKLLTIRGSLSCNYNKINFVIFIFLLVLSFNVNSEDDSNNSLQLEEESTLEDNEQLFKDFSEVQGLIIDRTMTRLGENFYFKFSQLINDHHDDLKENLTVKERPTAFSGSIIGVYHNDKPIYRTALSPGRRQAEERANEALKVVNSYIIRWEAERLYQDTFDLALDEF